MEQRSRDTEQSKAMDQEPPQEQKPQTQEQQEQREEANVDSIKPTVQGYESKIKILEKIIIRTRQHVINYRFTLG